LRFSKEYGLTGEMDLKNAAKGSWQARLCVGIEAFLGKKGMTEIRSSVAVESKKANIVFEIPSFRVHTFLKYLKQPACLIIRCVEFSNCRAVPTR
jgi:hypothetical protein